MASVRGGLVFRQIGQLFGLGTASGLTEWQLLHRYASERDEAAFAALVARHGPMVLGVCRRALADPDDVEDAFQATFLVLVRKAGTLRPHDALGHWLYGVARKVAIRARADSFRRRSRERAVVAEIEVLEASPLDPARLELRGVIDEELGQLPASYRTAVVLCYLEGLTQEEAARQLGWPIGTVKGRLARARDLLRQRLTRRGLASLLPTTSLADWMTSEAKTWVPEPLIEAALKVATNISAGQATTGLVSVSAASLAEGVLWAMTIHQVKAAGVALGLFAAVAVGAGAFARSSNDGLDAQKHVEKTEQKPSRELRKAPPTNRNSEPAPKSRPDDSPSPLSDDMFVRATIQGYDTALESYKTGKNDADKVHVWSTRIAMLDPDRLSAARGHRHRMIHLEEIAKNVYGTDPNGHLLDFMNAQFYRQEAALLLAREEESQKRVQNDFSSSSIEASGRSTGNIGNDLRPGFNDAKQVNLASIPEPTALKLTAARSAPSEEPGQDPRSQAVLKKLDVTIAMNFETETTLEDVLKYIKEQTTAPDFPRGIPIYVDPIGLQDAEKTISSVITINLDGVPLRRTLQLLLRQISLCYWIQDGMLVISSEAEDAPFPPPIKQPSPRKRQEEKLERGELSAEERKAYIELLKDEGEIEKLKAEIEKLKNPPKPQGKQGGGFQ